MKGILGENTRNWLSFENNSVFDVDKIINEAQVPNGDGETVPLKSIESGEAKHQAIRGFEAAANKIYRMLNGTEKPKVQISDFVKNSLNMGTFTSVFTPTVETFILDYIRPRLVLSNILAETIPVGPTLNRGLLALIRGFGLVKIKEVGKDQKLPTVTPNLAEYTEQMAHSTKKYGVKLEIENDLQRSDQWGVLGFLLTSIADGFRLRKELEVTKVINSTGEVLYDNTAPASGVFGVHTNGRGIDGAHNGTVTLEDIQRVFGYATMRGVQPTWLLVHPFVIWNMIGDSELSRLVATSGVSPMQVPSNAADPGFDHPFGDQFGYLYRHVGGTAIEGGGPDKIGQFGEVGLGPLGRLGLDPFTNFKSALGMYFTGGVNIPGANITLITSPQVPIKAVDVGGVKKLVTNLYVIGDKRPVGILQESNPAILEWEDIEMETSFMGFREKYTVLPLYQGRGIYVIKGAVIDKNYTFDFVSDVGSLSEPDTTAKP